MPAPDELKDSPPSSDRYDPKLDSQSESVLNLLNVADSESDNAQKSEDSSSKVNSEKSAPVTPSLESTNQQFQDFDREVLKLFGDLDEPKEKKEKPLKLKMDRSNPVEIPLVELDDSNPRLDLTTDFGEPKDSKPSIGAIDFSIFGTDAFGFDFIGKQSPETKNVAPESIQLSDKQVVEVVGGELLNVGSEGLVSIDDTVVKRGNNFVGVKKVSLEDGTYTRDAQGRVVSTKDSSGRLTRTFDFDGSSTSDKPSSVTIGDTTYKRRGPITSSGKPVTEGGYDMHSWSVHNRNGALVDNWYGDMRISEDGVFSTYEHRSGKIEQRGAGSKVLSESEVAKRDGDGIWPSEVSVTRPNDSRIKATMKGRVVESMEESYFEKGVEKSRTWNHDDGKWVSSDNPKDVRTSLKLEQNGTLSYVNSKGEKVSEMADGTKSISQGEVTNWFDKHGRQTSSVFEDGVREFKYSVDRNKVSTLAQVRTTIDGSSSTWTQDSKSNDWVNAESNERAKNLQVEDSGDILFDDKDGVRTRIDSALTRTKYDRKGRATSVSFESGAHRELSYDKNGLKSFVDTIPQDGETHRLSWTRVGNSSTFESQRDGDKTFTRENLKATADGDIAYIGQDGKKHVSETSDIDRIARGEFVLSSESLVEARDRLLESASHANLDTERFNNWVKEFEANARKYETNPEKVVKSMNNISDLLEESSDGGQYSKEERVSIAEVMMHNLARPLEIDQGSHPTCNVTSVEVYAAARHPDTYSGLVKDVALTGKWRTTNGKTVTPPMNALKPGKDERAYDVGTPDSAKRSLTSQVFQMTLINAMYETGEMNKKGVDNTDVRYIMEEKLPIKRWQNGYQVTTYPGEDELVRNGRKIPGNRDSDGPQMVQSDVLRSCELLFGDRPAFIENTSYFNDPRRGRVYDHDLVSKERLFEYKENNQYPILTPTMGGMHAQTIHDVWQSPKDGKVWVLLDNQHGEPEVKGSKRVSGEGDGDGWITLDTLHRTLRMSQEGRGLGQPVMPKIRKYDHPSNYR